MSTMQGYIGGIFRRVMAAAGIIIGLASLAWGQWTEQSPILQASDEVDNAFFGQSVAIDGNVAVVGAFRHPSGGTERGQAYVFRYNGVAWLQEQILQASDEEDFAQFGNTVTVDGSVVVVGSPNHSSGGSLRGQAYVYRYNGATWAEEQVLQASDEEDSAGFAWSVAVNGIMVVVGANGHSSGGSTRGQAYMYRYNGATWVEEQILQASDEVDNAYFGQSVAVNANVTVVGAYFHPSGGENRGQAYIYRYNGATWIEEQVLQASDEEDYARFGTSVAVDGNVALVGSQGYPSGGNSRGRAYVYRYNGSTWPEEQILQASDEVDNANFGNSVDVHGEVAVIGAYFHPSSGSQRGQAYVRRYNGMSWPEEQILQASDEVNLALFGNSVSVYGNVAVVGAILHPSGGTSRGQAYVFSGPAPTSSATPSPSPSPTASETPTASASPTDSASASPSPTPSPSATPNAAKDWAVYE